MRRRGFLQTALAAGTAVAGCTQPGSGDPREAADVIAGPGGRLVFEPADLTVSVGDRITWYFDSSGHNVSCRPDAAEAVALPPGADPFASYGPDETPLSLVPRGETYTHAFETPGEYVYVCVPHIPQGMIGRISVEA